MYARLGAGLLVAALALTACSGNDSPASSPATGGNEKVELTFVNWDGGMDKVVDEWNQLNPNIQVQLSKPSGTGYTLYNKLITNNKAGTNPDITQVEYQALPALIANQVVVPLDDYVKGLDAKYDKASLAQVQFEGKTYGVPQNVCPMVFFYRKDVFDKLGLKPPATWDEYATTAAALKKADPKKFIGNFTAADPGWFAGLAQQAGANWWKADGDTWSVSINDAASKKVADFWDGLITKGLVSPQPNWSAQWNTEMNNGTIVGWVGAQWGPNQLPSIAKDTAGKWAAAPLPAWTAGDATVGIWGGETEAVTANSKHPAEAAKFVEWLNSSEAGMTSLIKHVQAFPASPAGQQLPALKTPPPFMSNQPDYNTLMATAAKSVRTFDIWGPNANVTFDSYSNAFAAALQKKTPLAGALDTMQEATVADMKKLGFQVAG
ncbi:sugar ABC transporter substrate-binding protein [Kribbella sandramycini]|uniref:Multiple sugar transport system substrate-binding protein n=1 Tax=Kribbella sandramycini TaxID=60450 RepID=A0A7Y4KYQ5_9ACTN|nr:sugar ABC transporter substrate-binding protein [Kribbella sandramycini]MBB6569032.1 multiple sugar transport system substrate-binding protein [Kribbella sandramycini]NOL41124.1 sugar ABC transporter substrate-binding protein [Kribbella sandramycini]